MNKSLPLFQRLAGSLARDSRFNPAANRFFVEDQPAEPVLPLDHLVSGSPLFARYFNRARWLKNGEKGMLRFHLLLLIPILVIFALATAGFFGAQLGSLTYSFRYWVFAQSAVNAAILLMIASVPAALLLDLFCMAAALRQYRRTSIDDMVQLSRLSARGIIVSHYAATRLRAWRWMTFIFVMRLFAVGAFMVITFIVFPIIAAQFLFGYSAPTRPYSGIISFGIATCLGIAFVMEARWRLNGVAARALTVAVSRETDVPKEFVGLFNLLRLWIRQVLSLGVILFVFTSAAVIMVGWLNSFQHVQALGALFGSGFTAVTAIALLYIVRQHYLAMTHNELRRAERLAFTPTPDD